MRESREWIIKPAQHTAVRKLSESLGWPDRPIDKGLVVIVQLSGASASVMAIGPMKGDAPAYARALEGFGRESGVGGEVVWSREDDGAAARIEWTTAKFGRREGATAVDLPS